MPQVKLQKALQSMFQNPLGNNKGISIIEILIVVAIIGIAFSSLLGLASFSLGVSTLIKQTNQANNLSQEVIEAVRNFRDGTNWNINGLGTLTPGISYYPKKSTDTPPKWQLISGEEEIFPFKRKIIIEKVSRDPTTDNIEITYNAANDDPNAKKIIVTVSWKDKKVEIVTYLTNWK